MIIKVDLPFELDLRALEAHFKYNANKYLNASPLPSNRKKIETYIQATYRISMPLRNILTNIINSLKIFKSSDDYKIIIEPGRLDTIARLVTFGNRDVKGSSILLDAFKYAKTQL